MKSVGTGTEEMAQQLRTPTTLSENQGSVPSTRQRLTASQNSSSGEYNGPMRRAFGANAHMQEKHSHT